MTNARLFRAGLFLFGVGFVALIVDVLPFFFGDRNRPLWLNLSCLGLPIGFVLAVVVAIRRGRDEQRRALRDLGSS